MKCLASQGFLEKYYPQGGDFSKNPQGLTLPKALTHIAAFAGKK